MYQSFAEATRMKAVKTGEKRELHTSELMFHRNSVLGAFANSLCKERI